MHQVPGTIWLLFIRVIRSIVICYLDQDNQGEKGEKGEKGERVDGADGVGWVCGVEKGSREPRRYDKSTDIYPTDI